MKTLLALLGFVLLVQADRKRYDGYEVVRVVPTTMQQGKMLVDWMLTDNELDFWTEPRRLGHPVDIMVPPAITETIKSTLRATGMIPKVMQENIQDELDELWQRLDSRPKTDQYLDLDDYNTYEDIMAWMDELRDACAEQGLVCTTYNAGDSYQGREMKVLTIGTGGAGKTGHYIEATTHSREWLSTATLMKIMDHMIYQYGTDDEVTRLLDTYDFITLPVVNPDGYVYTFDNDRMWRKSRSPNSGSSCVGTDINRNFDHNHCLEGASTDPCSNSYCGSSGGSEVETQAIQAEAAAYSDSVISWLTIHTYGYMFMHPWGFHEDFNPQRPCARTPDHDDQYSVAQAACDAIYETHGDQWAYGTGCEVIYATTGTTDDYVYGVSGIKYPYCPELRGNSFIIDPSQIQPSFEEVWAGVVAMVDQIASIEGL